MKKGHGYQRIKKRCLALLLTVAIASSNIDFQAFAKATETVEQADYNEEIVNGLQQLCPDGVNARDLLDQLRKRGFIDAKGMPIEGGTYIVNGKEMSEDELAAEAANHDSGTVNVDGAEVLWEEISNFIQTKQALVQIQEYAKTETEINEDNEEEYIKSLSSLSEQLKSGELKIYGDPSGSTYAAGVSHQVRAMVSPETDTIEETGTTQILKVNVALTIKQNVPVTFSYRTVSGSGSGNGSGKVSIPAGETEAQFAVTYDGNTEERNGKRVFYIQCFDIHNALFDEGESGGKSISIPIEVTKADKFEYLHVISGKTNIDCKYTSITGLDQRTVTNSISYSDISKYIDKWNDNIYTVNYNIHPTTDVDFKFLELWVGDVDYSVKTDRLTGMSTSYIDNAKYSYSEHYSGRSRKSDRVSSTISHAIGRIAIDSSAAWQFTSTVKAYHGFSYSGGITMSMRIKEVHEKVNLTGLSIPDGTFYAGQSVPIVASFDEKIRIDDTVQLTLADGSVLTPVETGTSGKSCTFLYQVPNMPSPSIPAISELSFHGTKTFSEDEAILPEQDNTVFDLAKMQWDLPDKITTKNDNCLLRSYKDVSFADIQCTIDDNSPGNQWVTEVLTIDLSEQGAYGKWIQGNTAPVSGLDLKGRKDIRSASEVQKKLEGTSYAIYADRSQYSISEYVKSMYLSVDGGTTRVPFYVISRLGETTETNEIPVALIAQYRPELNIKQEERQELNELFMDPDTKSEIDYLVVNKAAELLFSQTSRSLPVPQSYLVKNAVFSYPGAASIDYSSDNPFFSNWSELVDNPSDLVSYHLGYDKDIKHVVTSDKENPDYYDSSDSEETYSSRNRTEGSEDKVIILKEESKEGAGDAIKTAQYEIENPLITKPFYVESDELRMTARFQEDFSYVGTENLIWVSSDESIATVSYPEEFAGKNAASYGADRTAAVNIVPTGKAGTVYFTLYNLNGGITGYTPVELCRSVTLLCEAGKGPFLKISSVNGKEPVLSCRQKESLDVCFTSNLTANNASTAESTAQLQEYSALDYPTAFTMEVYETDFKGQPAGEPVYKKTECSTNSHTLGKMTIPEGILQNVYGGTDVSYAVKIYAESLSVQDDSSKMVIERELLTASAGICVCSNPPEVYLGKLKSYSILDNQDLKMSYDMKSNGATLAATSITITDSDGEEVFSDSLKEGTNAVTWKPELVTGQLKKVYIVRASVQEKDSETPSTDSYILYVYNHGALDILVEAVDGKNEKGTTDVNEITLDNHSKIQNLLGDDGKTISIDGQKISLEGLMRDINLSSMISINYGDFVWGQISDQIKWETSSDTANEDSSAVTLNYEQSGYYSNIDSTSYVSYAPCENFMSVGLKDGESKITATQARTGMSSTISITSKTVKDQLYLFKFLPELETKVEYVNGKGENCIVHSNKAGELAVYEESGIKSDVYFYSENDQGSYIGTIGNQNLVSGEKDISKLENYPVNNVRLRSISNVNLYIIDNDGNPYANQKIWLRGGVYKNSEYCYAAKFGTKKDHLNDGKEDQIFTTDSSGKITAYFDSSQFYTMEEDTIADRLVNPNDEISYSFEVKFQLDDDENPGHSIYEPQFVHINALVNTSNFANACSASIQLRDMARYAKSVKPKTPVINSQYFYQFERNTGYMGNASKVYDYKGSLGISWKYPTAVLDTEVLMWGEPVETEELIYKDKNGNEFNYGKQMKAIEEGRYQVLYKNYTEKPVASQKSQVICYPFADMPVVETLWTMEKKDFDTWMDDETYEALTCTIYDGSIEMKNMANSFTVCNQADKEPVGQVKDYFQDVLDWLCGTFCWLPKDYERNLFNKDRIVGMASSTLTSLVSDEGRPVSISLSPTVDPLCFHAVISIGVTPAYKNFTDEKSYSDTGEVIISKYEENSKEIFGDKVTYTSRSPASEEPSPSPSPSPEATDGTAEGSTENGGSYTAGYKDSSKKSKVKEFLAAKLEKPVGKMTKYIEDIPKDSKVKAEERKKGII